MVRIARHAVLLARGQIRPLEPVALQVPEQRPAVGDRAEYTLGTLSSIAQGPFEISVLTEDAVSGEGDVDKAQVFGQLVGKMWIVIHQLRPDSVAAKAVALVVVPVGNPIDPVADMVRGVLQQLRGQLVIGEKPGVAWQEQQEGLGTVGGLRLRLVPVDAVVGHPTRQIAQQRAESLCCRRFAGDQVVRQPGEGVIGLILAAAIAPWSVDTRALIEPGRQLGSQLGIVGEGLFHARFTKFHEGCWPLALVRQGWRCPA